MAASEFQYLTAVGKDRNPIQESRFQELKTVGAAGHPSAVPSPTGSYLTGASGVPTAGAGITGLASAAADRTRKLLQTQRVEEAGLSKQFETTIAGQEKLPAMYKRIGAELGIPGQQEVVGRLRNEILRIEGLLEALPEDVKSRVRGTWTTEAMRRRLEASETTPLARSLSMTARAQEGATGTLGELMRGLGTQMGFETAEMEKELLPIKQKLAAFGDRAAREITGYTSANQMELDALLTKLKMDQELTRDEQDRAHDLAVMERSFEMEKESLQTSVVTAGGRIKLINTQTGATIADLGASKTGGTDKGLTTAQKEAKSSEIARFLTTEGSREEAEEAARAMIAQGYPSDIVYEELDRQFPKETDENLF